MTSLMKQVFAVAFLFVFASPAIADDEAITGKKYYQSRPGTTQEEVLANSPAEGQSAEDVAGTAPAAGEPSPQPETPEVKSAPVKKEPSSFNN